MSYYLRAIEGLVISPWMQYYDAAKFHILEVSLLAMYYFAYASNLNQKQMRERCPESQPKFTATLPNYKLIFVGWSRQWRGGKASIKPFRGERVLGAIYEVSDRDLRRLDGYEGYPKSYDRLNVTVFNEDDELTQAVTYIKAGQSEETQPSPGYLSVIRQGYRDWRII